LLASASVTHVFREDEFTWAGTLRYTVTQPDYTASIPSANFTSSGTVYWESASLGQVSLDGTVTGSGTDRKRSGTTLRDCSSFTVEESGLLDLTLDASAKTAGVNFAISNSANYTQYTDRASGSCPQGDAPSLYFGGDSEGYTGAFNPSTHTLSINYADTATGVAVVSPATTTAAPSAMAWTATANTDFAVALSAVNGEPTVPESWISLSPPDGFTPDATTLDAKYGRLQITVTSSGKPPKALATGASSPVGNLQVQWASSTLSSATLQAIPVNSVDELFGAYWNTREMTATVSELPAAPSWARFVKVTVTAAGFTESTTTNNSAFIPLRTFEAKTGPILSTPANESLTRFGTGDSVLEATDLARYPNVYVNAYNVASRQGAFVFISDAGGGFLYDPSAAPAFQSLAAGETIDDAIEFLATENGSFVDDAIRPIRVVGVNDPPTVGDDSVTATESTVREINPSALLANDSDIDRGDTVRFKSVDTTSQLGAIVSIRENGSIAYDPTNAALIRSMRQGETRQDSFLYTIVDRLGLESTGQVNITVSGTNDPPQIAMIEPAIFPPGATNAITVARVSDFDTDTSQVTLTIVPQTSPLLAAGNIVISGSGENRLVTLTPNSGVTGRVRLTAQATSAAPESLTGTQTFFLVAGTATDTDLDGVLNSVESSAFGNPDSNSDGIADQTQPYLAVLRSAANDLALRLEAPKTGAFANVAALGAVSNPPANTTTPWGGVSLELHTTPGATVTIVFASDSSKTLNSFYTTTPGGTAGATNWQWLMWNGTDGPRVYADRVEWVVRDGGRGDADGQANGVITASAQPAKTTAPWRNQAIAEDVNNNGGVEPLDALLVINYLNSTSPRNLPETIPSNQTAYPIFFDVSGDNVVAPIDALRVINRLNGASGEGESHAIALTIAEFHPASTLSDLPETRAATSLASPLFASAFFVPTAGSSVISPADTTMDPTFAAAAGATVIDAVTGPVTAGAESLPAIDFGQEDINPDSPSETLSASDAPDPFAAHDALFARWH
jgi:VCBS repeat-containing protein